MRLFLVRHGETVDNVAGLYAGTTDSALTNHGILQANRLGAHLVTIGIKVSHIFSSDLSRAFKTAEAIRLAQPPPTHPDEQTAFAKETFRLKLLREQDFGSLERKSWSEGSSRSRSHREKDEKVANFRDPGFKDVESKDSMGKRADNFIYEHLLPLIKTVEEDHAVVVVAHGIILGYLWGSTLKCFPAANVVIEPGVGAADRPFSLEYLGGWANTGYLELEIRPEMKPEAVDGTLASEPAAGAEAAPVIHASPDSVISAEPASTKSLEASTTSKPKLQDMRLFVKAINSIEHLRNVKKTRGGIGSSAHDEGQKTIESFFKKRRIG